MASVVRVAIMVVVLGASACAQSTQLVGDAGDAGEAQDGDDAADRGDARPDGGCRPWETNCSGTCADLTTDPLRCGGCTHACAPGEVCNEGVCASRCTSGLENCSGACVDLDTDPAHCGSCARACGPDEECRDRSCICVPDCTGRECGDDGCGGSCGDCPAGRSCGVDGRCFCASACIGRACGDDGCGGSCGSCAIGFSCTPAGTCSCGGTTCGAACCTGGQACLAGSCCEPSWRADLPGRALRSVARDADGTLYVAGSEGDQAYVAAYGSCGVLLREGRFRVGTSLTTTLSQVVVSGEDVYVVGQTTDAGADTGNGAWARLPKSSLVPTWATGLWGGDNPDEVWAIAVAAGGAAWMVGTAGITATGSLPWVILGNPTGAACGFSPLPVTTSGVGRDVLLTGGRIYVTGARDGMAYVTSFGEGECPFTPGIPCACTPSGSTTDFQADGATFTEVRALAFAGGSLYVAGFADVGGDLGAMVGRLAGPGVTYAPRWNPTTTIDGYTALAPDPTGAALYAVGTSGWSGSGEAGNAVVARYGAAGLAAEWQAYPLGAWACWDVVVDDLGGVVVACVQPGGSSTLRRCLPTGTCP